MKKNAALKIFIERFFLVVSLFAIISSAMITFFFIKENDIKIAELKMQIEEKQNIIKDSWNDLSLRESKAGIAIILSLLDDKVAGSDQVIMDYLLLNFPEIKNGKNFLKDILNAVKQDQESDFINSNYEEQIELQRKASAIEKESRFYYNLALFFQTIALFMAVLNRDVCL